MSRNSILNVLRAVQSASSQCPCHGTGIHKPSNHQLGTSATNTRDVDYAFEVENLYSDFNTKRTSLPPLTFDMVQGLQVK